MSIYFSFINTDLLDRKLQAKEFPFSQYLFWDTPVAMIDIKLHKKYIIERVLVKGFLSDFYMLLKLYTKDEIAEAVKNSKMLDAKTVNFCSYYFNVSKNELHASSYYS